MFWSGRCKPKDINSNYVIRGAEKRIAKLLDRISNGEDFKKAEKEIRKLTKSIEVQKELIKIRNIKHNLI